MTTEGHAGRSGASSGTPRVAANAAPVPQLEQLGEDAPRWDPTGFVVNRGRPLIFREQRQPGLLAWGRKLVRFIDWMLSSITAVIPVSVTFGATDDFAER